MLPVRLAVPLREQLAHARELHRADLDEGFGAVWLPDALDRQYPSAAREWGWQYVFPADARSIDPRDGVERRHHLAEQLRQRQPGLTHERERGESRWQRAADA